MVELLKRYALGAVGLAVAAYALMQMRAADDALRVERERAEQREKELQELVQLLQRDSLHRVVVEVEQAKASSAEVRARPASVLEAKASDTRGVAWDKQLDDALARGRRAGAR